MSFEDYAYKQDNVDVLTLYTAPEFALEVLEQYKRHMRPDWEAIEAPGTYRLVEDATRGEAMCVH
jgi:hypothetical protein